MRKMTQGWLAAALIGLMCTSSLVASDRMNVRVLSAFRDVVSKSAQSTTRILADNQKVALGAIVTSDGYILTKSSELKEKYTKLEVQLFSGKKHAAKVVGIDRSLDLALLKIDVKDLPAVEWMDSDTPQVGSLLATPGLERDPVAIGVVSVAPRKIPAPSGALGILLDQNEEIVRIVSVKPGSAAEKAGLAVNDVIKTVSGKKVSTRRELIDTVRNYQPKDRIELLVRRGEEEFTATAVLDSLNEVLHGGMEDHQNTLGGPLSDRRGGFSSALQHDSVLLPRDCGGPLCDLSGKAIGLNIARAGRVESYALPYSVIKKALPELMSGNLLPAELQPKPSLPSTVTMPVSAPVEAPANP